MFGETSKEISSAIKHLNFSEKEIKLLSKEECELIYHDCLNHFVNAGDRYIWWEDYKLPYFVFPQNCNSYDCLNEILPDINENVWFIAEDDDNLVYPVYDAKSQILRDIIYDCSQFEYYIISKRKDWLLCETHHNDLIGIGEKLRNKNISILTP